MNTIEILKKLDVLAMDAHLLWRKCENLKILIADESVITENDLSKAGIYPYSLNKKHAD